MNKLFFALALTISLVAGFWLIGGGQKNSSVTIEKYLGEQAVSTLKYPDRVLLMEEKALLSQKEIALLQMILLSDKSYSFASKEWSGFEPGKTVKFTKIKDLEISFGLDYKKVCFRSGSNVLILDIEPASLRLKEIL